MPNLQFELDQLARADEHIEKVQRNIAHMEQVLAQERASGAATEESEHALRVSRQGLQEFHRHRELIVMTIGDIKAGRVPST
jgi:hypothetical protein